MVQVVPVVPVMLMVLMVSSCLGGKLKQQKCC